MSTHDEVAAYYDAKTQRILDKYGPGPRVHFHTGLCDDGPSPGATRDSLRRSMVEAQERLLTEAFAAWDAERTLGGHVLDVGCGLGGGMLLLAERTGARVTGVTIAERHPPIIRAFARALDLEDRVEVLVVDAAAVPGDAIYDAAIAVEASCYFDRAAWFACLARVLKPGAVVHVVDCFVGREDIAAPFDAYWRTCIGTLDEYQAAAGANGFAVDEVCSLNDRCARFWDLSLAHIARQLGDAPQGSGEYERLRRSEGEHARLRAAFRDGAIRYLRVCFRRRA